MSSVSVDDFYERSRLHFIGDWKHTAQEMMRCIFTEYSIPSEVGGTQIELPSVPPTGQDASLVYSCVVHVDMDCFFASVAMRARPELRDVPIAVCYEGKYAEISSCNYPARVYGVRSGMYLKKAREICPSISVCPYDFDRYKSSMMAVYRIVLQRLRDLADNVDSIRAETSVETSLEVTAVDDFYIAFRYTRGSAETQTTARWTSLIEAQVQDLIQKIRADIENETQCTASAGISKNCLLAKMLTKSVKPNGQRMFFGDTQQSKLFLQDVLVAEIPGVGPVITEKIRKKLNANTCADLQLFDLQFLQTLLGSGMGKKLYKACRGMCDRTIVPTIMGGSGGISAKNRAIACGINYGVRPNSRDDIHKLLQRLCHNVSEKLIAGATVASRIMLQVKYRHPDAPVEPIKKGAHGWCKEASSSSAVEPPSNDQVVLFNVCVNMFQSMRVVVEDVRGITAKAKVDALKIDRSAADEDRSGTLTQIYRNKSSGDNAFHSRKAVRTEATEQSNAVEMRLLGLKICQKPRTKVLEKAHTDFKEETRDALLKIENYLQNRKYVSVCRFMKELQKSLSCSEHEEIRNKVYAWTSETEGIRLKLA